VPLQFFFSPSQLPPLPVAVFAMSAAHSAAHSSGDSQGHSFGEELHDLVEQLDGSETTILLDIPTLQGATPCERLGCASHALVPLTPDVHSVAVIARLRSMLSALGGLTVRYAINRFDESRPPHREVRSRLHQLLGSSLLPIAIRDDPEIEELAAQGMTVVDAFPESSISGSPRCRSGPGLLPPVPCKVCEKRGKKASHDQPPADRAAAFPLWSVDAVGGPIADIAHSRRGRVARNVLAATSGVWRSGRLGAEPISRRVFRLCPDAALGGGAGAVRVVAVRFAASPLCQPVDPCRSLKLYSSRACPILRRRNPDSLSRFLEAVKLLTTLLRRDV